jgi:hypothetical protein
VLVCRLPLQCPNVKPYLNAEWSKPNIDCSGRFKPKVMRNGQLVPQESDEWGQNTHAHARGQRRSGCHVALDLSDEYLCALLCCFPDCEYAHTLLELMYHPQVYKTSRCDHFSEENPSTWKCVWRRRCAHSHGREDIRSKEEATEQWRQHLMVALPRAESINSLARLLSAGQTALETLNQQQGKSSRSNSMQGAGTPTMMAASPGGHGHWRSLSGDGMRESPHAAMMAQQHQQQMANMQARQPTTGALGQMRMQQQQQQQPSGYPPYPPSQSDSLTHSPQLQHQSLRAPLQRSDPTLTTLHSTSQGLSPRNGVALPSPSKGAAINLGGGLGGGFFSGSDTSLWAPSPKNANTAAPPTIARAERFTFESAGAHPRPELTGAGGPSVAWSSERESDRSTTSTFGPSLTVEDRPRSRVPSPRAAAPRLTTGSPSPDAHMPTSVVQTLWLSPPPISESVSSISAFAPATVSDILGRRTSPPMTATAPPPPDSILKSHLSSHLQCAYPATPSSPSHLLSTPITTPCCGVSICQACVPMHLTQCATALQSEAADQQKTFEDEKHAADALPEKEGAIGKCTCGRTMRTADVEALKGAPVNQALDRVTKLLSSSDLHKDKASA